MIKSMSILALAIFVFIWLVFGYQDYNNGLLINAYAFYWLSIKAIFITVLLMAVGIFGAWLNPR